jgi:hypothetical protein
VALTTHKKLGRKIYGGIYFGLTKTEAVKIENKKVRE